MEQADYRRRVELAMRVRQNVAPAAVGATFLLYFGFFHLAEPTGTGLFDRASWVFYHTLRVGGAALAAIAAWSLLGQPITLAIDAVVTVAIGALLILTGLGMAIDGGEILQTIINVVCGGMFTSSGIRNWRDYRLFRATKASVDPVINHATLTISIDALAPRRTFIASLRLSYAEKVVMRVERNGNQQRL